MQSMIEEKKQEIKNKIKSFFNENNIQYREVKERIEIQGKIFSANLLPYPEINMPISRDKVITVKDRGDKIFIIYFEAYPKEYRTELKISKAELDLAIVGIYYLENKLVFLF